MRVANERDSPAASLACIIISPQAFAPQKFNTHQTSNQLKPTTTAQLFLLFTPTIASIHSNSYK